MVVAEYYGGNKDYKNYYDWIRVLKTDFYRFNKYILENYDNKEELIYILNKVLKELLHIREYNFNMSNIIDITGENVFIDYSLISTDLKHFYTNTLIIRRDYKFFILVDNLDPKVETINVFKLKNNKVIKSTYNIPHKLTWLKDDDIKSNLSLLESINKTNRDYPLMMFANRENINDEELLDKEYEEYNKGVVLQYFNHIKNENYEVLDYLDDENFSLFIYWMKYFREYHKFANLIESGEFITNKGITFKESIINNKKGDIAQILINHDAIDPNLYITAILYSKNLPNENIISSKSVYIEFSLFVNLVNELVKKINSSYEKIEDEENKKNFIGFFSLYLKSIHELDFLLRKNLIPSYDWLKEIRDLKYKKLTLD